MPADRAVSIVIAVWDRYCEFLTACVSSALAQSGETVEVIVVDNASDQPLPLLPESVRIVRSAQRLTAGRARNLGLDHVRTPLVLFLDADDQLLPTAITRLKAVLDDKPRAVAAVGKHLLCNPATGVETTVARAPRPAVYHVARTRRSLALLTLRHDCFPLVGCGLIRTDAVRECGGFGDSSLAEDWVLRSALAFRGRIAFVREPVVRVRVRTGSLWHRPHSGAELQQMFDAFHARRRGDPALPTWGRLLLPLIAVAHRRDIRRLTRHGAYVPRDHGLLAGTSPAEEPRPGELSVIVCTHQRPDHLRRCLEGLSRCAPSVETVVVDSASQTPCADVVSRYQDRIANLRYVYVAEPGLSIARNAGIDASHGELVAFVDDDAIPLAGWDRAVVGAFRDQPEVGCVGGACHARFEGPRPRWLSDRLLTLSSITRFGDEPRAPRSSAEWPFGANLAFRRDALEGAGRFSPELGRRGAQLLSGEDSEMVERTLRAGWRVWLEPRARVLHCVHQERLRSGFYWRRLWWAGVGRAHRSRSGTTIRLLGAVPVRLCLWLITRDRIYLYRLAESAGYVLTRLGLTTGAA